MSLANSIIANPSIAQSGERKIDWVKTPVHMPIIDRILKEYTNARPLDGLVIATSIHMEAKTARLVQALTQLGAEVYATGCNPLSTQDDVAASLATTKNVTVFAKHGCHDKYRTYLEHALSKHPHIIIDDGGDLVELLHTTMSAYADRLLGGCEETTTGINRLKALKANGKLAFPMFNVNDAECKHNYDNHYGTGQSTITAVMNVTNLIIAGKTVVVAGYGHCGSGIAMRMRGMGAKIIITEIDPIKALKAHMDGFTVMTMDKAAFIGDIFITATGCNNIIVHRHFAVMKDGAILANAGHFNVEVNAKELIEIATSQSDVRDGIEGFTLPDGRTLYLLAEGRLVNLAAGDGHPAEIMDMSFAIQLLSVIHIAKHFTTMVNGRPAKCDNIKPNLYPVPTYIDNKVAELALSANHIAIDHLSAEQRSYLENGF